MSESQILQNPEQIERLRSWNELNNEMNRRSRYWYDDGIEEGVNDASVGINAVLGGYYTKMSCEGHDGGPYCSGNAFPWVGFDVSYQSQLEGLKELLNRFYADREVNTEVMLGIYDDFGGEKSGQFAITTAAGYVARMEGANRRAWELLVEQQEEMSDFADFLKDEFLNGYQIVP